MQSGWVRWMGGTGMVLLLSAGTLAGLGLTGKLPVKYWTEPNAQAATAGFLSLTSVLSADNVRVGISDNSMEAYEYPSAQISANGPFRVLDLSNQANLFQGKGEQSVTVSRTAAGLMLQVDKKPILGPFAGPLEVESLSANHLLKLPAITRKGKVPFYHGHFEVVPGYSSPSKLTVVNVLPLQEYLKAVVPNELPARYGLEAIKAQAVAARNYAIHPREKPWPQFDICDSQYCQVYFGSQSETPETTNALKETEGLLALYQGEPILALYSSSHGGYSEDYANAFSDPKTNQFPATPLPYLKAQPDIPTQWPDLKTEKAARDFWTGNPPSYDMQSPLYRWTRQWDVKILTTSLNQSLAALSKEPLTAPFVTPAFKQGESLGILKQVTVLQRGTSGKAMVVVIEGSRGKWTVKKEFVIRKALQHGGKMLPSANFVLDNKKGFRGKLLNLVASGGGFGHGVGMSQLGASWMAQHGHHFQQIIQHYYTGAALGTLPLKVGASEAAQPIQTLFYSPKPTAVLWVVADSVGGPAMIQLNGQPKTVNLERQTLVQVPVTLKLAQENTLILYPDVQNPNRKIKAWIEVVPASMVR